MEPIDRVQFDAYIMVDWSANNTPKKDADSIWYCVLERTDDGTTSITALENPTTRISAVREVTDILIQLARRQRSTLIGFDFPYGYPTGFAAALNINSGPPWQAVWSLLSSRIVDSDKNRSNRFQVAAELNAAVSNQPFPFWGCPSGQQQLHLTSKRGLRHSSLGLAEFRFTDKRNRGPQPVWKLCYPGSVGSQALLGIPYLNSLRFHQELANISRVWPFETGFALAPRAQRDWTILHAEIYPSIRNWAQNSGECKDRAQVRGLAEYFAQEDEAGTIGALFEPPTRLSPDELEGITSEEGWILGIR